MAEAGKGLLQGIRVVEFADEKAEYCGLLLGTLGADVIKVEPPNGSSTREIGPFYQDRADPERSLFFWNYNRGKKSIVLDLTDADGRDEFFSLLEGADIFINSSAVGELDGIGLGSEELHKRFPTLVIARMTPFGETGPWAHYQGSDLVHLALGGPMMNCGYSPLPDGTYDMPPIAPQAWHAYHIAGEQLVMMSIAALVYRRQSGAGQVLDCSVHEAVSKNTELDLMNWVMRHVPLYRQTCAHAAEAVSHGTTIQHTKDGRWFMTFLMRPSDRVGLRNFLEKYGFGDDLPEVQNTPQTGGRAIPGSNRQETGNQMLEVMQRFLRRYRYEEVPWREAQDAGVMCVPLRRPEENVGDEHWQKRGTFAEIWHPEIERSLTYPVSKWISTETDWIVGRRAPQLNEDIDSIRAEIGKADSQKVAVKHTWHRNRAGHHRKPMALDGIRVLDFTWFLASAGGTRFLSALGAECIKVEWAANPDTRLGAMAPVGGREARRQAAGPIPGVTDNDMGGQFNNKNAGKRGMSLNVRHPQGLEIARKLVAISDIVAEGFSPGVLDRWGLGYDVLTSIKPDIIYAQQSGMGGHGNYGRFRAVGPIAASLSGMSEMSGMPSPAMPAGWGYSYLDWIGAYSFAVAMLSALYYRDLTGKGQWIDASQTETGIYLAGTSILDWDANGRNWARIGNRSPFKPAAPHGVYHCDGADRWIAIGCFDDTQWHSLCSVAGHPEWESDANFCTLADRIAHQDELDARINAWTSSADRYEIMHALQKVGVPAGVCQTAEDRCDTDPQLAERQWLTEVTGTKIGQWPVAEVPVKMSETPTHIGGVVDRGAPCYGEDNEYVLGELLGYSAQEISQFKEDGVI